MPSEAGLIRWIQEHAEVYSEDILESIGDDCAILAMSSGRDLAITTDILAESVHFERRWCSAYCLGRKSLAVNLSDLAAMGAQPLACLLNLSLPRDLPGAYFREFMGGFLEECSRWSCSLIGGDLSVSHSIQVAVTALGTSPSERLLRRSGAKPGDLIVVAGRLGLSRLGLEMLANAQPSALRGVSSEGEFRRVAGEGLRFECLRALLLPEPLVHVGVWLGRQGLANSMIDVSDGLSTDLMHIAMSSGVRAVLDWPALESLALAFEDLSVDNVLNGGEDYALLFTCSTAQFERLETLYPPEFPRPIRVGELLVGPPGLSLRREKSLEVYEPKGYDHFL